MNSQPTTSGQTSKLCYRRLFPIGIVFSIIGVALILTRIYGMGIVMTLAGFAFILIHFIYKIKNRQPRQGSTQPINNSARRPVPAIARGPSSQRNNRQNETLLTLDEPPPSYESVFQTGQYGGGVYGGPPSGGGQFNPSAPPPPNYQYPDKRKAPEGYY